LKKAEKKTVTILSAGYLGKKDRKRLTRKKDEQEGNLGIKIGTETSLYTVQQVNYLRI
jgi:hypothetical protein